MAGNKILGLFLYFLLIQLHHFTHCLETLAKFTDGLQGISFRHPETGGKCLSLIIDDESTSYFALAYCEFSDAGDLDSSQVFSSLVGCTVDSNKFSTGNESSKLCVSLNTALPSRSLLWAASFEDKAWDTLSFRRLSIPGEELRHLIQNVGSKRCLRYSAQRINGTLTSIPVSSAPCDPKDAEQHFITCASNDQLCGTWQLV